MNWIEIARLGTLIIVIVSALWQTFALFFGNGSRWARALAVVSVVANFWIVYFLWTWRQ